MSQRGLDVRHDGPQTPPHRVHEGTSALNKEWSSTRGMKRLRLGSCNDPERILNVRDTGYDGKSKEIVGSWKIGYHHSERSWVQDWWLHPLREDRFQRDSRGVYPWPTQDESQRKTTLYPRDLRFRFRVLVTWERGVSCVYQKDTVHLRRSPTISPP